LEAGSRRGDQDDYTSLAGLDETGGCGCLRAVAGRQSDAGTAANCRLSGRVRATPR